MIMKTLKYILLGIMLCTFIPVCHSQSPATTTHVITLQSAHEKTPVRLLSESKDVLLRRLKAMDLHDVSISQENSTAELVVTVKDTITLEDLSDLLLVGGHVSFKADSIMALNKEDISEVHADFGKPGSPSLCLTLIENRWKEWEDLTARNVNKSVAFIIDGKVYAAPRIKDKISHGQIALTGDGFSKTEVRKLVAVISCGPVPLKFNIISNK